MLEGITYFYFQATATTNIFGLVCSTLYYCRSTRDLNNKREVRRVYTRRNLGFVDREGTCVWDFEISLLEKHVKANFRVFA